MERFKFIETLGSGSSGTVSLVVEKATQQHYVMKQINLQGVSDEMKQRASREAGVLQGIDHPNVVKFKTTFIHRGVCCIVMEKCERSLEQAIEERRGEPFPPGCDH